MTLVGMIVIKDITSWNWIS